MGKIIFLVILLLVVPYKRMVAMSDEVNIYREKLVHFFRNLTFVREKEINLSAGCGEVCKEFLKRLSALLDLEIVTGCWPYQYLIAPVEHATLVPLLSGINLTSVLALSDGNIAIASGNVIKIIDIDSGLTLQSLKNRGEEISCLTSLGNEIIAAASFDGKITVWNLQTAKCIQNIDSHNDYVSVLMTLDDRLLVSASGDGAIKIWNPFNGVCLERIDFKVPICALNYWSGDYFIVALDDDFSLRLCDRIYQKIFKGHEDFICAILQGYKQKHAISASCDGVIKFWDFASRACLKSTQNEEKSICSMITLSCGDFATISKQGIIEVRSATTGESIRRYDCGDGFSVVQQKNGDLCILGKGGVRLLSLYPRDLRNFFYEKNAQEYDVDVMLNLSQRGVYDYPIFYVALLMQLEHHRRRHEIIELHPEWVELFQALPFCYQNMYEASVVIKKKNTAQQRRCVLM